VKDSHQLRDKELLQFIPQAALLPCELCHFFPIRLDADALIRRTDRQIAKCKAGPRREKLERLRRGLSHSDAITLYLHGSKELFTFPVLKAAIPTVTLSNWTAVRDYIFYGPRVVLTPGLGSFFFSIADRFCSRKTMRMIVIPTIADLRFEYVQAVREGRFASAIGIRVRATWDIVKMFALHFLRKS
jgi:hypothetical protein